MQAIVAGAIIITTITTITTTASAAGAALGALVGKLVRANYQRLQACYRQSLAVDRSRGGTLFVKVTLGRRDAVEQASVARDEIGHAGTAICVTSQVRGWIFSGAAAAGATAGSEIYVPLTFRADLRQIAVATGDVVPQQLGGRAGRRYPLLTARNSGARRARLELWELNRRYVDKDEARPRLFVVLNGRLKLGKYRLAAGGSAILPAGKAVVVEPWASPRRAGGARGTVRLLWVSLAAGSYSARLRVARARHKAGVSLRAGAVRVTERRVSGGRSPVFSGKAADTVLFVRRGQGTLTVGKRSHLLGPGHAVYLRAGQRATLRAKRTTVVVEIGLRSIGLRSTGLATPRK